MPDSPATPPRRDSSSRVVLGCLVVPIGLGIPLIGIAAGIWMIVSQEMTLRRATPVRATVDSVDIRYLKPSSRGERPTYVPLVRYHYAVSGRTYSSTDVTARIQQGDDMVHALARANRYTVGQTVDAWYDSANPARAFLIPGRDRGMWLWTAIWLVPFTIFALVIRWALAKGPWPT